MQLANFDVDAGKSEIRTDISVDGAPFAMNAPTFIADGSTLQYPPTMEGGDAILQGTTVTLTKTAADALDKVFGGDGVHRGLPGGRC